MGKIITQCPSCGSSKLDVVKIECKECGTIFEGKFAIPVLLKLPEEDLQFIFDFVKCSGSLKEMAQKLDISYPTLRNRLNALIATLDTLALEQTNAKAAILELLEQGKVSAKEAAAMLRKLGG